MSIHRRRRTDHRAGTSRASARGKATERDDTLCSPNAPDFAARLAELERQPVDADTGLEAARNLASFLELLEEIDALPTRCE
jgi:hypothetical protein